MDKEFVPCDICESKECVEVPHSRSYTNGEPVHICSECGFVHAKYRRSAEAIAQCWASSLFGEKFDEKTYSASVPAVRARQMFVAEFLSQNIGMEGKTLCDIGSGDGQFLEMAKNYYGARVFGVDPSPQNGTLMTQKGIENFVGTAEDYYKHESFGEGKFDVVTMMWTLVNSYSCRSLMDTAHKLIKPGGHLLVAEGSRILVPFKKPLNMYFSKNPPDLHSFHFSRTSLGNLFSVSGFEVDHENRFLDSDVLCLIGKKSLNDGKPSIEKENAFQIYSFFDRWHMETKNFL